jgi:hypothetical protein
MAAKGAGWGAFRMDTHRDDKEFHSLDAIDAPVLMQRLPGRLLD